VKPVHTSRRRVEFRDTDAAGIMHFSVFYTVMEEVEHEFLRSLGLSVTMRDGDGEISWPRVSTSCEYRGPLRFEDEFDVDVHLDRVGGKSVTYRFEFRHERGVAAVGKTVAVCCRMVPHSPPQPISIPTNFRTAFESAIRTAESG
jgi:acyl-CoA thioester hydrolase